MTFSSLRNEHGQGVVESLLGLVAMLLVFVAGVVIVIHGLGTLILNKYASENAHCIAQEQPSSACEKKVKLDLERTFSFKNVKVRDRLSRGIIHSEIDATLIDHALLTASYDLEPSEYKRTSK